jgi:REP element-mobilizing transposase RayT
MKLEILESDHFYHIYNRGINSENIFLSDDNKSYFLKLLSKYLNNNIEVFAYCLMDNHFHFFIKIVSDEKQVTQAFSNLFNAYAKAFNKQNNRTGSLFEKHFKRIKIQDENYLRNIIQYIHLNPKHHLNIDYKNYKFSSFQSIISDKETKLARTEVLNYFDTIDNFIFCHDFKNEILSEKFTFD